MEWASGVWDGMDGVEWDGQSGMGWQGGKNIRIIGNGLGKNLVYDTTVHSCQSPQACQLELMYCNLHGHPFRQGGSNLYNVDFNSCELLNIF